MKRVTIISNAEDRHLYNNLTNIITNISDIHRLSHEIILIYIKCDIYNLLSVVEDGASLTVSSKLSKNEFLNGITSCIQLNKFFDGTLASGYDVLHCAINTIHSDSKSVNVQKQVYETIGDLLVKFSEILLSLYFDSKEALQVINDNNIENCLIFKDDDFTKTKQAVEEFIAFCEGGSSNFSAYKTFLRAKTLINMQNKKII